MARYADYLAIARLEQLLADPMATIGNREANEVAAYLVHRAVDTSFLPRRRQVTLTFDLPDDDDPPQDEPTP